MEVPFEIQEKYLERRRKDLDVCILAFEHKDFIELERIGHKMKGNAITFGHAELAILGKKLEVASKNKELPLIEEFIYEFSKWLTSH